MNAGAEVRHQQKLADSRLLIDSERHDETRQQNRQAIEFAVDPGGSLLFGRGAGLVIEQRAYPLRICGRCEALGLWKQIVPAEQTLRFGAPKLRLP